MQGKLKYNKDTGVVTLEDVSGDDVSFWFEIESDDANELIITLDVSSQEEHELSEGIEDGN